MLSATRGSGSIHSLSEAGQAACPLSYFSGLPTFPCPSSHDWNNNNNNHFLVGLFREFTDMIHVMCLVRNLASNCLIIDNHGDYYP